ncbi:MAG: hypothetical protein GAK30_01294 [Paracidovorax wautersii]|uniref:Tripartite-type tricarboxylate transporter, receptor component TctC n=1 Tax=Paracidovorax wautersii TaxID=1177982 RepID=A0A7V8FQ11_9BURK|nr:MAG: hypothetical protein GAK30_01294 [Paracidovorax wautersii]
MNRFSLNRRDLLATAATAAAGLAIPWAHAQSSSVGDGRPVTLVVTYPPGGGADIMARIIAPRMAEALGQPVVVENRPGASGQIAAGYVARAKPDGTTLLVDASSFAVNPSLYATLPYDSNKAFTPLAVLATFPNVMVCAPSFAAQNVQDVIAQAKAKPGELAFASSGNGSAQHLAGELFEERAGVRLTHIPYRGGAPALNDVMGGQVPLFFANVASALGHIQSGKLRALAVTNTQRARSLPQVPTMAEAGVAHYQVLEWNPVLAPAGVAASVQERLVAALRHALDGQDVRQRIHGLGGDVPADTSPKAAAAFIAQQQTFWGKIIRERNITAG